MSANSSVTVLHSPSTELVGSAEVDIFPVPNEDASD
jgi:hypothetical protein